MTTFPQEFLDALSVTCAAETNSGIAKLAYSDSLKSLDEVIKQFSLTE